jgi:hypothetical protein
MRGRAAGAGIVDAVVASVGAGSAVAGAVAAGSGSVGAGSADARAVAAGSGSVAAGSGSRAGGPLRSASGVGSLDGGSTDATNRLPCRLGASGDRLPARRGMPGVCGSRLTMREQAAAMWFGPKGFASVVYGLIVLESGIEFSDELFHLTALTISMSILAHSSTDVAVARQFEGRDIPEDVRFTRADPD